MTIRRYKNRILAFMVCASAVVAHSAVRLDELCVAVDGQREYSYSDKSAGFFYGMTGVDNWQDGNAGWNVAAKRVLADYQLSLDGNTLNKACAETDVYPYKIVRKYKDATETMYLVDGKKVIVIDVVAPNAKKIGIALEGDNLISLPEQSGATAVCQPSLHKNKLVRIGAQDGSPVIVNGPLIEAGANSGGFVLAFGEDAESARLLSDAQKQWNDWILDRKDRMQELVNSNSLMTNNDDLDKSMAWMMLTADELVTRQHGGWGIYAGFPWFTDFWGRDMFIAMPGTVLCPGQFDVAKNILLSFAKYQDLDKKSPTYGRVPNRLNLEGILYNTTDGTPRFVMQVLDYLKYTGDVAFLKSIYNNVKVATDAALDLYVDDRGYLTHADADTWMDAKRQGKYPCSPRGNRAVDIQALWFCQLESAAKIADCLGKKSDADRWRKAAEKLKGNFQKDFVVDGQLVDHLNADGTADRQLRPNTMFAYSLIDSDSVKREDIRKIWSRLTYPWGVSSLDQMDNQFHPYHEQWHRYHKDDAYHNGTVWLWLNGMAMQRMIEFGQEDEAYKLLENMNRQALKDGAVGSLSECADAWCRPGLVWSRRSGTFLQSWSNSEQLRVWSQYFLGVRPNLLDGVLVVAPRIPSELNNVETTVAIGCGRLEYVFKRYDGKQYLSLTLSGQKSVDLSCELKEYDAVSLTLGQGKTIEIEWDSSLLTITDGVKRLSLQPNPEESMRVASNNEYFDGVDFAMPCYREDLNTMSRYFNPPLDYYSVE